MTAFTTPVTTTFQRAAHLIDAGYAHGAGGNLYKEDATTLYTTDAPFDRVTIMHKSGPGRRMRLEFADICW